MVKHNCNIVSVGKRRDGGTRYWCLAHRADATVNLVSGLRFCESRRTVVGAFHTTSRELLFNFSSDTAVGSLLTRSVTAIFDAKRFRSSIILSFDPQKKIYSAETK